MAVSLILVIVCLAIAGLVGLLWVYRSSQAHARNSFRLLQESLETFQRSLVLTHQEDGRSAEMRSSTLRQELADALQKNREEMQRGLSQTTGQLEHKVAHLQNKVEERLEKMSLQVQTRLEQNLKDGFVQFEKVQLHLKQAEAQLTHLNQVGQSINDLNSLLKLPHLRGGFGEATLERLLTDMLPTGAFELQYKIVPTSTERVDAVIHYPKAVLPIDSKFPREQVLPLFETNDPAALEVARRNLADWIKGQAKSIKEKYIHPEHGTADMALLFVPSETLYFEMIRNTKLCEEVAKLKVFPVSPNTLAVTLHSISISRNYYEMAQGVETTISEIRKAQTHFDNFERRFEDIGNALNKAQTAFGTASTHLSRYGGAVSRLTGLEAPAETAVLPPEVNA